VTTDFVVSKNTGALAAIEFYIAGVNREDGQALFQRSKFMNITLKKDSSLGFIVYRVRSKGGHHTYGYVWRDSTIGWAARTGLYDPLDTEPTPGLPVRSIPVRRYDEHTVTGSTLAAIKDATYNLWLVESEQIRQQESARKVAVA